MVIRVCIVGAGPSGMSTLAMFKELKNQGEECEVTCYEKQEIPGGLWNLSWRTGTDGNGETVHCSMYRDLFSNGPKECLEFPEYTFIDHFGKDIPSYPPRSVLYDYLKGFWKLHGVSNDDISFRHIVRNVEFDDATGIFRVRVTNLVTEESFEKEFDRLIVASGHFSVPNVPEFEGIETFTGRVMHSHDFRNSREFKGQRVVLVGGSYSAEDIALQLYKFGAEQLTISIRSNKMGFVWPDKIKEVELLTKIDGKTCYFKDGSSGDYDAIILCTGYRHSFPFMPKELRLPNDNSFNISNVYRNIQWYGITEGKKDADGRLFYLAMQNQEYSFTMFMLQAKWAVSVIKGILQVPEREVCVQEAKRMYADNANITDPIKEVDSQTEYVRQIAGDLNYTANLDCSQLFREWLSHKYADITTYRDHSHVSLHTGAVSPVHPVPWLYCFDDSLKGYVNACDGV